MAFTLHNSWERESPLKRSLPTGASKPGLEPQRDEIVVVKHVNGGFFGTDLEIQLRRAGVRRLVVGGFFTNFCVETTVCTAGNKSVRPLVNQLRPVPHGPRTPWASDSGEQAARRTSGLGSRFLATHLTGGSRSERP